MKEVPGSTLIRRCNTKKEGAVKEKRAGEMSPTPLGGRQIERWSGRWTQAEKAE